MARRKKLPVADRSEVLEVFTSIMRGEMTEETVRRTGSTEERSASPPRISERCKAAELLGKQMGLFERKEELQPRTGISEEIRRTLKELHDRAEKGSA